MAATTSMCSAFGCAEQSAWCWNPAFTMLSMQPFEANDVLLQKVPTEICESSIFLDTMLEQAGLEEAVVKVEVLRKQNQVSGELIVTLSSKLAAQLCVQMIDGALWMDSRGSGPVRARLLAQGHTAVSQSTDLWGRQRSQESSKDNLRSNQSAGIKPDSFRCAKSDASDSDEASTAGPDLSSRSEDTSDDERQLSLPASPSFSPVRGVRWADISDSDEEL